jgi:hypothetical protein
LRKTWFLSKGYIIGKFKEILLFCKEGTMKFFSSVLCVYVMGSVEDNMIWKRKQNGLYVGFSFLIKYIGFSFVQQGSHMQLYLTVRMIFIFKIELNRIAMIPRCVLY